MNILNIASTAIVQQSQRMEQSAKNVAAAGDVNGEGAKIDLAREAVTRIEATNLTTANVNVIKAEDERTKTLLDIFV
ncbi:MAG: hypothetical protein JXX29_01860 [Deltaproteobacteria bacterium]|nr:hypothetical protein [Deltaproteobacteria bacterium]MBN2670386.1 hypothetical protein [Deltaproteobacteria bacterium]